MNINISKTTRDLQPQPHTQEEELPESLKIKQADEDEEEEKPTAPVLPDNHQAVV